MTFVASATASSSRSNDERHRGRPQAPSANVMVFLGRDTNPDYAQGLYFSAEIIRRAAPPDPQGGCPDSQAGAPDLPIGVQPVADPNPMSGTFFTRVASVLPS